MPREFRVKPSNKGPVRRIRLRPGVAYPAVTVALVASIALVLTPLGATQGMALGVLPTPTETTAVTTDPPAPVPTTVEPTTVPTTAAITLTPTTLAPAPAVTTAPGPVPNPTPGLGPSLAPILGAITVDHHVLARIEDFHATYLAVDTPVLGASPYQSFRVRFQVRNNATVPMTATPRLEYRPDGAAGFALVPEEPQPGSALYVSGEWVASPGLGGGTEQGPLGADIPAVDLMTPSAVGVAVVGHHSMGVNPDKPITLAASSYTEEEFTVRLTTDAKFLSGYELRITNGGAEITGTKVARIVLGPQPALQLTAGQRQGVSVDEPTPTNAAGVIYWLLSAPPKTAADTTAMAALPAASSTAAYPLAAGSLSAASDPGTVAVTGPAADGSTDSHDIGAGQCSSCHRGHTAKAPDLTKEGQQSTLCFSCHDGTGSTKNVKSQYPLTRPLNNAAEREYYSHEVDTTTSTPPSSPELGEFGGLSNRRSGCADCHNSHKANATDSTPTADGWDASGRLAGVSGVSVVNGAAGAAPTYTFLSGLDTNVSAANLVTREYQLCFKCHSGFTTLTSNTALTPSRWALDKAIEFNPANPSFHPVEAAGKNTTPKMEESLAGTSPYKRWNFNSGSTIRCLNCHASGTPVLTPPSPAGGSLQPHTSSNRGILLENYRDRVLKPSADVVVGGVTVDKAAYNAGDFALCYVCHAEEPFRNQTANKTNFSLHGWHLIGLEGIGPGAKDIDTAGDGQGNAICAECHFRIHSTTNKVEPQTVTGTRLVNFAPNVKPKSPTIPVTWTQNSTTGGGTCSLTCHGYSHTRSYP